MDQEDGMNVVSVMAHQDDELVCLGTMLKMRERGDKLHFICCTDGCFGIAQHPEMGREEAAAIRDTEMRELADRLGASYTCLGEQDVFLCDTPRVRFRLLSAMRAAKPDVVFTHFSPDFNVDHMTVNTLVRQCAMAMGLATVHTEAPPCDSPAVFLVEPSGTFEFDATHYVDVTAQTDEKMALAALHRSQDELFRIWHGYGLGEYVTRCALRRGEEAGVEHAEAIRPMLARKLVKAHQVLP
jgi:LmbE family N-acetylglucosaminyl deacetylase